MDNETDSSITFDQNGYCNYCTDVIRRMPDVYFQGGGLKLKSLFREIRRKCRNDTYDCLVGLSGGIDSSFLLYLGYRAGLRMLAVHVDDGLDNPVAGANITKLTERTGADLFTLKPDHGEYADLLRALFKASVPNLAIVQDNLILKAVDRAGARFHIRYSLDGHNIAHESILERGDGINFCDKKHILAIHRLYGAMPIHKTEFISLYDRYVGRNIRRGMKHVRPLNYLDYRLDRAVKTLENFCGFEYYGGKHYESVLTRYLQCYYLPVKYGVDKRKSHFSSLIVSGQMSRKEALEKLRQPLYPSADLLEQDKKCLADFMGISVATLERWVAKPPEKQSHYPHSRLNELAPLARKFRKFIE